MAMLPAYQFLSPQPVSCHYSVRKIPLTSAALSLWISKGEMYLTELKLNIETHKYVVLY